MNTLLFQVAPTDPAVYLAAIAAIAIAACLLPAIRATRINPVEAFRHDYPQ